MFDKYLLRKETLTNVVADGEIVGFKFAVRNSNYRGVFASLHNGYYLVLDGELIPRDKQKFEVNGKPPRDFDEMKNAGYEHWDFDDEAWVHVERRGGLTPGKHSLVFKQAVFSAYGYFPGVEEYVTNPPAPGPETRHFLIMDKTYNPVVFDFEIQPPGAR